MRHVGLAAVVALALGVVAGVGLLWAQEEMPYKVKDLDKTEVDIGNGVMMKFTLIPKGKFMMGSESTMPGHRFYEEPYHEVTLTRDFWMGTYEVTQKQYETVMQRNISHKKGADHPVEVVSWLDAVKFCKKASEKSGKTMRLPTEAEWEYSCRAGTTTPWSFGDDPKNLGYYAWFGGNASTETHPVGQKRPNPWGLYDMHGNVWEWVHDRMLDRYNPESAVDPTGSTALVAIRSIRGGSYFKPANICTSYRREGVGETILLYDLGFRVMMEK